MMLKHRSVHFLLAWSSLLVLGTALPAADDVAASLVPYLPESANVVAVIRVDQVLKSPRGKTEGWAETQQEKFLAGASSIPPWVDTIVLGMQVRPKSHEVVSSVGLASVPQGVQLEHIAQREGDVSIETLGGQPAVQSKHNAYYVALSKTVLGIVFPAVRQEAARYVRHVSTPGARAPQSYLSSAAQRGNQIIIAMDLRDLADASRVQQDLERVEGVRGNVAVRDELLELLSSIEGVRFTADVDDTTQATVSIDFGKQPGPSALLLKGMVLRVITDAGLHINELDGATAVVEGQSLVLRMANFSDPSLRLVLSTIALPAPVPESPSTPSNPRTSTTSQSESTPSLRYFRTVNQCLDDLQQASQRNREPGQNSTWHENIARKIDKLPTRGVDPVLVEYGAQMSKYLRGLAVSLTGVRLEVDTVQKTLVWNSTFDPGYTEANIWGGYGYRAPSVNVQSNLQQVRERQAEAVIRGQQERDQTWQIITEVRAQMTETVRDRWGLR